MHKIDDAETYFLNFVTELPNEAGGIPVGLYLLWASGAGLLAPEVQREVARCRTQGKGAADTLFEVADGKLLAQDFNDEGVAFSADYYGGAYLTDYARSFGLRDATADAVCSVPDTAFSLEQLKPALDARLVTWRTTRRDKSPAPASRPPTTAEVFAQLKRELLPELRADGFEDLKSREHDLHVRRRVGVIEQQLLFMVWSSSGRVDISISVSLGAERLRRVWLGLSGRERDPPAAFTVPVQHHPEVRADDLSLTEVEGGYAQFFARVPEGPERKSRIVLMHYLEAVRPRLNAMGTVAELARQVQFPGQRRRLTHKLGYMNGPELLARIILLAAYTEEFQAPGAATLIKQLHQQILSNIARAKGEFPDVGDVDRLIEALKVPGTQERVRAELDLPI